MLDVVKIRAEAEKVNRTLGRFLTSSLEPLLKELGTQPKLLADAGKVEKLQEIVYRIPADKQIKYKTVFDLLKPAGIYASARPCDPSMHYIGFQMEDYFIYPARDLKGKDFPEKLVPGSVGFEFHFKWKSTSGSMQSLANVYTQEWVKFRRSQREAPFNHCMADTMEFYWGKSSNSAHGWNSDVHSIKPPRLVCRYPWVAGELVAEQWYQYSHDGINWKNIPGAAYLITRGVRGSGSSAVFFFRKENWAPHNEKAYKFEAELPLGKALECTPSPNQTKAPFNGSSADIHKVGRIIHKG